MPSVELQFATMDDSEAWMIRNFDHGSWSHVDAVLPDGGGLLGSRSSIEGGINPGVQVRPFGYAKFTATKRVIIQATLPITNMFYGFLSAQVGKPYDYIGLVSNFLLERDWRADEAWWCSELQGAAMEASGALPFKLATPTNLLTPNGLFMACSVLTDIWKGNTDVTSPTVKS